MGFKGSSGQIPLNQSALNHSPNIDALPPWAFIHPTRNLDLHNGLPEKRRGTAKVNSTAITGTPRIMGVYNYIKDASNEFVVFAGNDGKVYKNTDGDTIKTGMSTSNKFHFETLDDGNTNKLFICDGANIPQVWDGAAGSTSDITSTPTDWTGSNYPQVMVRHNSGAGQSVVNIALGLSTNWKTIYISQENDPQDFSDANVVTTNADTGDGIGPVAGIEFGKRFFAFGKEKTFYLDDTSSTTTTWQMIPVQWFGGTANKNTVVKTDTDIISMMEDGTIYSIRAAEQFGDYQLASIARPAFIDRWIQENVDLSSIADFHMVWDRTTRAVFIFVKRSGETQINSSLVYYVDRPPEWAWMVHENLDTISGYNASASSLVKVSAGEYKVYTGDYAGFVWKLGQANRNDDGNGYYGGLMTPDNHFGSPTAKKKFKRIRGITEVKGDYEIEVNSWVDSSQLTSKTISLSGIGDVFDTGVFDTAQFGGENLVDKAAEVENVGKRLRLELFNNTANEEFALSSIYVDAEQLGVGPR